MKSSLTSLAKAQKYIISKRWVNTLFKATVLLLFIGMLYYELSTRDNLDDIWASFVLQLQGSNLLWLGVVVLLMPFNWLAETQKWHQFVRRYEHMSRRKALMAVFAGVSLSLFTPNRVGEYGGRILFVHPDHQWKAVVANLVGNFCQYMVLLATGVVGAAYFLYRFDLVDSFYSLGLLGLAFIALGVMFFLYFHIEQVFNIARKIPLLRKFRAYGKHFSVFRRFNRRELSGILQWAFIRYVIYASQYFLLLWFFGIKPDLAGGFAGIATLFFLQTSLPLPPLTGLVARGNLAIYVWSQFGANDVSSLAATFTLWIINLIIPALIGTFSLFYVNITKSLGYEDD